MAKSNEETLSHVEKGWKVVDLVHHKGFWIDSRSLRGLMAYWELYEAQQDDIMLITPPKSGTTWLKALAFAVVNRTRHDLHNHPLLTTNPQDLVPYLDIIPHGGGDKIPELITNLPSPRLLASHLPYQLLPTTIIETNCRIVYLCRNPKDTFVSMWHFANSLMPESETPLPMEEAFEMFCSGITPGGPLWEHLLAYWKASLERPERVLFIKYEELKEDPTFHLRRLAEFLGWPFSLEEEKKGVVEEMESLCSFESLKSLEVNKSGKTKEGHKGTDFFRRGVVGDWKNHLTAEMIERMDQLIQQNLGGSGLMFKES